MEPAEQPRAAAVVEPKPERAKYDNPAERQKAEAEVPGAHQGQERRWQDGADRQAHPRPLRHGRAC
eukprot:2101727-Prymnesium_polylepis.1